MEQKWKIFAKKYIVFKHLNRLVFNKRAIRKVHFIGVKQTKGWIYTLNFKGFLVRSYFQAKHGHPRRIIFQIEIMKDLSKRIATSLSKEELMVTDKLTNYWVDSNILDSNWNYWFILKILFAVGSPIKSLKFYYYLEVIN